MAVRTDFAAGEVLAAADLNDTFGAKVDYALPVNAQTGTTYTFVLADGLRLTTASNAAASTYTVPPQSSVVWLANSVIRLVNYGAGVVTVAGGSGVTVTNAAKTLAQFESVALIRTGSNAWTLVPFSGGPSAPTAIEYLVIAGGGGGGARGGVGNYGAGGGSGGYRCSALGENSGGGGSAESPFAVIAGTTYTITVGAGGANASANSGARGGSGSASSLDTVTTVGGGGGGAFANTTGLSGGAGGGGTDTGAGGTGTANQGYAGGAGASGGWAGGGGGAGAVGSAAAGAANRPGGAGVSSSITGSAVTRGVGGEGGDDTPVSGSANTGNGGSGASQVANASGAGGKGVVIIRHSDAYPIAVTTGSPTITNPSGYRVYVFNDSGTIKW